MTSGPEGPYEIIAAGWSSASMRVALNDLKLAHLTVLYPGARRYALADQVTVVPAVELAAASLGP